MTASLLPAALSLVCAFSQTLCNVAQHVTVQSTLTYTTGSHTYAAEAMFFPEGTQGRVMVDPRLHDAGVVGSLLAHELTHAQQWQSNTYLSLGCVGRELGAYTAEHDFAVWRDTTFGPRAYIDPNDDPLDAALANPKPYPPEVSAESECQTGSAWSTSGAGGALMIN